MSNLALRLKRLWVDWCEHNRPDADGTPWPAEAFLQWASRELRVEIVGILGDSQQCALLRDLAPHTQEHWPSPSADEHPTDPNASKPSTLPPFEPFSDDTAEELLGIGARVLGQLVPSHPMAYPRALQRIDDKRPDLAQRGKLAAGSTLELGFQPRTHASIGWFEGQFSPFSFEALERVSVTSVTVRGEEMLVQACPAMFLMGRQNEGLMRLPSTSPGDAIVLTLKNESNIDLDVELRLHGVEPVKETA